MKEETPDGPTRLEESLSNPTLYVESGYLDVAVNPLLDESKGCRWSARWTWNGNGPPGELFEGRAIGLYREKRTRQVNAVHRGAIQ